VNNELEKDAEENYDNDDDDDNNNNNDDDGWHYSPDGHKLLLIRFHSRS
jgi:hypothetical protein